jgi:TusA-related sulfurtransferase
MATPITADMKVNEVLKRYPQTLDVFVRHGFKPLANPLMRRTFAHLVSIKGATQMHHWEPGRLDGFLRELNARAAMASPPPDQAPEITELPLYDVRDVAGLKTQGIDVSEELIRVDNRGLEPPEPMVRILAIVQQLAPGQRMEALNERRPMLLYPKIEELGLSHETEELPEGGYRITVRK